MFGVQKEAISGYNIFITSASLSNIEISTPSSYFES